MVVVFEGMGERQHKGTCVRQGLGVIYRVGLSQNRTGGHLPCRRGVRRYG